jgi:uncharacterized protein YidB (DUF937 family)
MRQETAMGLLDDIGGTIKGVINKVETEGVSAAINDVLAKNDLGDLQGLVNKLQLNGLQEQVQSWLSSGPNLPISAQQIRDALGSEQVRQFAEKFGLPIDDVTNFLAAHLPAAVDNASPQGKIEVVKAAPSDTSGAPPASEA